MCPPSESAFDGVGHAALLSARSGPPAPRSVRLLLGPPVGVLGVGHSRADEASPTCLEFGPRAFDPSIAVGVGQGENEEPLALVACTHFKRRVQSRLSAVAKAFQVAEGMVQNRDPVNLEKSPV